MLWCCNDVFCHCNEKGTRLESATVPAAVMPDHAKRDDGFGITCHCELIAMGRLPEIGTSQKTCQTY